MLDNNMIYDKPEFTMNISSNYLYALIKHVSENREKILEHFCMAYLAETNLKPSEIVLVSNTNNAGEILFYFDKKENYNL